MKSRYLLSLIAGIIVCCSLSFADWRVDNYIKWFVETYGRLIAYQMAKDDNMQHGILQLNHEPHVFGVTPLNGALLMNETDLTVPERGGEFAFTRAYNSKIWFGDSMWNLSHMDRLRGFSWLGMGWDMNFCRMWIPDSFTSTYHHRVILFPDGRQVFFAKTGDEWISTNGSWMRLRGPNADSLFVGDGTIIIFENTRFNSFYGINGDVYTPRKIIDKNGNIADFYYAGDDFFLGDAYNIWPLDSIITSSDQRVHFHYHQVVKTDTITTVLLDSITYRGYDDSLLTIKYIYDFALTDTTPWGKSYFYSEHGNSGGSTILTQNKATYLLRKVVYPNGDTLRYDYNDCYELTDVHTLEGGLITYEYKTDTFYYPETPIEPYVNAVAILQGTRSIIKVKATDPWSQADSTMYERFRREWTQTIPIQRTVSNADSVNVISADGHYQVLTYEASRAQAAGDAQVAQWIWENGRLIDHRFYDKDSNFLMSRQSDVIFKSDSIVVIKYTRFDDSTKVYRIDHCDYDDYGNARLIHQWGDSLNTNDDVWIHRKFTASDAAYNSDTAYFLHLITEEYVSSDSIGTDTLSMTKYTYDGSGYKNYLNPPQWVTPIGDAIRGDLTKIESANIDEEGCKWTNTEYRYDNVGNAVQEITHANAAEAETTFTRYNSTYNYVYPVRIVHHLSTAICSLFTEIEYDSCTGMVTKMFDVNGDSTVLDYDVMNRVTRIWPPNETNPVASRNYLTYESSTTPCAVLDSAKIDASTWAVNKRFYDGFHRLMQQQTVDENSSTIVQCISYGSHGLPDTICNPYRISGTALNYTTPNWSSLDIFKGYYDGSNRISKIIFPDAESIMCKYDSNIDTIIDGRGNKTTHIYNAFGAVDSIIDALGNITKCEYDRLGRLTKVIDAEGKPTKYYYDMLGRVIAMDCPDATFGTDSVDVWHEYDNIGNLIRKKDANGWVDFEYDDLYRLTKIKHSTNNGWSWSDKVRIAYDTIPGISNANARGKPAQLITVGIDSLVFYYNNRGAVKQKDVAITGLTGTKVLKYQYNYAGLCTLMVRTHGLFGADTILYDYNRIGQVKSIGDLINNFQYNPAGEIVKISSNNGDTDTIAYDVRFRPIYIYSSNSRPAGGDNLKLQYFYDQNSNVDSIIDLLDNTKNYSYAYDVLNRLDTVYTYNGSVAQSFTYDKVGNRMKKNTSSYTYYSNTNRLQNDHRNYTYYYDESGNITKHMNGTTLIDSFVYDWMNRLVEYSKDDDEAEYEYNASGLRVKKYVKLLHLVAEDNQKI